MVDHVEAAREVDRVRRTLRDRYEHRITTDDVDRVVDGVAATLLAAPVLDFIGVLVERAARAELDAMQPNDARSLATTV